MLGRPARRARARVRRPDAAGAARAGARRPSRCAGPVAAREPRRARLREGGAAWSCIACGIVVAIAAGIRLSGTKHAAVSWALVAAGAWLIASAVLFDALPRATTNCAVCGALLLVAGLVPLATRAWVSAPAAQHE